MKCIYRRVGVDLSICFGSVRGFFRAFLGLSRIFVFVFEFVCFFHCFRCSFFFFFACLFLLIRCWNRFGEKKKK